MKNELLKAINEFPYWEGIECEFSDPDAKEVFIEFKKKVHYLLRNIQFELRAPNQAIVGSAQMLNESFNADELNAEQKRFFETILKFAERNQEVINKLNEVFGPK